MTSNEAILMRIDKKLFIKGKLNKEIDKINKTLDKIKESNRTIDYVNETMALSNGEIIDRKNFSIMSLPRTKDILREI